MIQEWFELKKYLSNPEEDTCFENQFFQRLVDVHKDPNSGVSDKLSAYRDALMSCPSNEDRNLPISNLDVNTNDLVEKFGLVVNSYINTISLSKDFFLKSNIGNVDLTSIYELKKRRFISKYPLDPALKNYLNNDAFESYNGKSQRDALRHTLLADKNETLIINIPTGFGKTLIAHALTGFSNINKFTLVIVPTIALAIDQGKRVVELFEKIGISGVNVFYWHGGQDKQIHDQIKENIKSGKQKILFCSPESACRSLLPTLYQSVENDYLSNVVVDEAHLVDHWGADFRPYFQIFSAVFNSLRKVSKTGIKCVLMSATFSPKTLKIISELFSAEEKMPIKILGNALRPEIQYDVKKVNNNHLEEVVHAANLLPKPLIIYTVKVETASQIYNELHKQNFNRLALFTGLTSSDDRDTVLNEWAKGNVDIVVATSAFGVGVDKANVRSVLHAEVPENLDRFYQEVGRSGRDGLASQSLLIYHDQQFEIANNLNSQKLITTELGLERWRQMWNSGQSCTLGKKVSIGSLRQELKRTSEENEKWNLRTLLLMQRSKLISISFEKPNPPEWDDNQTDENNKKCRDDYYDYYYKTLIISPISDSHLNLDTWNDLINKQRNFEIKSQNNGFFQLKNWIYNSEIKPLCLELEKFYTIEHKQPEYCCGGCPGCRNNGRQVLNTTIGKVCHVEGFNSEENWGPPLSENKLFIPIYYDKVEETSVKKFIRNLSGWLTPFIENGTIKIIRSDKNTLNGLAKKFPRGMRSFWVGETFIDSNESDSWSEIILLTPDSDRIPDLGFMETPQILLAPKQIPHPNHSTSLWWERDNQSMSLKVFLSGISYDNH